MTPALALFATRLFSSVGLLPVWRGSVRQEVKAPEPVLVLVALFGGSIRLRKNFVGIEQMFCRGSLTAKNEADRFALASYIGRTFIAIFEGKYDLKY